MRWICVLPFIFALVTNTNAQAPISVAVAANLAFPLRKIKQHYENTTGNRINLVVASSGVLTAQISNGAPYALFLSADMKFPKALYQSGKTQGAPQVLVKGRLVFWSKKKVTENQIGAYLATVRSVAIAQPKLAPYGQAAKNWLEDNKLYPSLERKLVYGENIGQVNRYIVAETVEGAFTAVSAMFSNELKNKGFWLPLSTPADEASLLTHGMVILKNESADPNQVKEFVQYLKSAEAQSIFEEFGYVMR